MPRRLRELGDFEIPLGKAWFELRLTRDSGVYRFASPFWPLVWKGWLLLALFPSYLLVILSVMDRIRWMPSGRALNFVLGIPVLLLVISILLKTKVIDTRKQNP